MIGTIVENNLIMIKRRKDWKWNMKTLINSKRVLEGFSRLLYQYNRLLFHFCVNTFGVELIKSGTLNEMNSN